MAGPTNRIGSDIVAAPTVADAPTGAPTRVFISKESPPLPDQPSQAQAPPPFGQREIITIEVNGQLFTNWTSVRVEQKVTDWFPVFQFELTEASPTPLSFSAAEFMPGDLVRVYVGGVPAVFGYITERQVSFDATNHGVKLTGAGKTIDLTTASVPLEQLNGHDGQSWQQLAESLCAPLGIGVKTVGTVDAKPFENIAIQPGDTIQSVLERYARGRNIVIGSDPFGNLLAIGENQGVSTGDLVEGGNILRANCAIRDNFLFEKIVAVGQGQGSDSANGDTTNKQVAVETGSATRPKVRVIPYDISESDPHGNQRRAKIEKLFTDGSELEAQITVQGWFKDYNQGSALWRAGEYYTVNSPDMILYNKLLGCAVCAYEQNDGGSTTTLTMVLPIYMNALFNLRLGSDPAAIAAAPGPNQTAPL